MAPSGVARDGAWFASLGRGPPSLDLPTLTDRGDWGRARALLGDAVGESTFEIWLDQVELIAVDGNGVLVLAVNEQTASWVRKRFGRLLSRCVERTGRGCGFARAR